MLGVQLANGVIQPLTNFLLNDLTRVQQKKMTFQAAAKGMLHFMVGYYLCMDVIVLYVVLSYNTDHEEATEKFSRVSKVRETERVSKNID